MAEHEEQEHSGGGGHGRGHGGHGGGGGGGHEEHHEGAPEWLISFADNVALMMGFFVILLAMNMKEPTTGGIGGKENFQSTRPDMIDAVLAIREGFGTRVRIDSTNPEEQELVQRLKERKRQGESRTTGPEGTKQDVQSIRPTGYEAPCAVISFDDGSIELNPDARTAIADAAATLAGQKFVVDVRGNVSANEAYLTTDRGAKLSFERAFVVARALEENGLKWRQLRIVAGGDSNRMTQRAADRVAHRTNQRTELYQTNDLMPDDPYAAEDTREP